MNLDWITNPLTIYGVVAAGGLLVLCMTASINIEMRRQQARSVRENRALQEAVCSLQERVNDLLAEANDRAAVVATYPPSPGLNVQKRAEALRMYRRGCSSHTVCATLGLPRAEVALLEKVQKVLCSPVEEPSVN